VPGFSAYVEQRVLEWLAQDTGMPAAPNPIYISLHTADPAQNGASEVAGGGYARVSVSTTTASAIFGGNGVAGVAPVANGTKQELKNSAPITFPAPTGDWGTCTYWGAWDAATGGNFLIGGALTSSVHPISGNSAPSFGANAAVLDDD